MSKIETVEEKNRLLPVKCEEKGLTVVKPKEKRIVIFLNNRKSIKNVAKKMSIALIGTISVAYIVILTLVATSVFYVSNLTNGLIQKRSLYKWYKCITVNK